MPSGEVCDTGLPGPCAPGVMACVEGAPACVPVGEPDDEVCDGLDNDCDFQTDEDAPGEGDACGPDELCGRARLHCIDGGMICVPEPLTPPEVCNGLDDDCDGEIDEGLNPGPPCETGRVGGCATGIEMCAEGHTTCVPEHEPGAEKCDGVDDDCDGITDNIATDGNPCETGEPGVCAAGRSGCIQSISVCQREAEPSPERCDGLDNDCDGETDEGGPGDGQICATGWEARCAAGHTQCRFGRQECVADVGDGAAPEICNREDDDCDGHVDEGTRNACGHCGPVPHETCNGLDDDCNGFVDDDTTCPDGQSCAAGRCRPRCGAPTDCGSGERCHEAGVCVPACTDVVCAAGELCRRGACVDPCAGVRCGADAVCIEGHCVPSPCAPGQCPEGMVCAEGACLRAPCEGVVCGPGQMCRAGQCVASCGDVRCTPGWYCDDGVCHPDLCVAIACAADESCLDGACVPGACAADTCDTAATCVRGTCVEDPCALARCPGGEACGVDARGVAQCTADWRLASELPPDAAVVDLGYVLDAAPADAAVADAALQLTVDAEPAGSGGGGGGGGCHVASPGRTTAPRWALLGLISMWVRRRGRPRRVRGMTGFFGRKM